MSRPLALLLAVLAVPAFAQEAEPAHEAIPALVTMSDGVRLDATVYLPLHVSPGKLPLIVRHHGGGSNKHSPFDVQYVVKAVETGKFAALMYSARGHGESEGMFDFFGPRTTQDFSEMLDWVAAEHGARIDTQNVGSSGYSQGGGGSLRPATQDARVKALAVGNTFSDLNHALNPNDVYKFAFATGIFVGAYTSTATIVDVPLAARWGTQLMTDTEDVGTPLVPSATDDMASRSPLTGVAALVERKVPTFWTNAWEDQLFPADHPERILKVLAAADVPVHYWFASGGHAAGANFLPEEQAREAAMLAWFEQFLLGEPRGFSNAAQVDYWQRETGNPRKPGEWTHHTSATWPIAEARTLALYPQEDGSLGFEPAPAGQTATLVNSEASFNVANDALVLEVAQNVPGMGDVLAQVPESRNPLDTLTFTSAPLLEPINAVGAPEVVVKQSSTHATVQQLVGKVWDVGPEGARLLWRGAVSGNHGDEVRFPLWPNAHRFEAGHQVVLMISAVDFPTFQPDREPWTSTLDLSGTRVELPATAAAAQPRAGESEGVTLGAMGGLPWLLVLALLRLNLRLRRQSEQHGQAQIEIPVRVQDPVPHGHRKARRQARRQH